MGLGEARPPEGFVALHYVAFAMLVLARYAVLVADA